MVTGIILLIKNYFTKSNFRTLLYNYYTVAMVAGHNF